MWCSVGRWGLMACACVKRCCWLGARLPEARRAWVTRRGAGHRCPRRRGKMSRASPGVAPVRTAPARPGPGEQESAQRAKGQHRLEPLEP